MGKRRTPSITSDKLRAGKTKSSLEQLAASQLLAAGLGGFECEQHILRPRRFRFDIVWLEEKVVLEVHGVFGYKNRHLTAGGFMKDREKMALAQLAGYIVIEAGTTQIKDGSFVPWVRDALALRAEQKTKEPGAAGLEPAPGNERGDGAYLASAASCRPRPTMNPAVAIPTPRADSG